MTQLRDGEEAEVPVMEEPVEEPVMVSPPVQTLYEGMAKVEKLLDRLDREVAGSIGSSGNE